MRVRDLQYGSVVTLHLEGDLGTDASSFVGREVRLVRRLAGGGELVAVGDDATWRVTAEQPADEDQLDAIRQQGTPRVAWLAAAQPTRCTVQVHRFVFQQVWAEPMNVGIGEDGHNIAKRNLDEPGNYKQRIQRLGAWLEDELLLDPAPGRTGRRALVSATPGQPAGVGESFTLHGQRKSVDVIRRDGEYWLARVTSRRSQDRQTITLVEGELHFPDRTMAGFMQREGRAEIQAVVDTAESYLHAWDRYNELEREQFLADARDLGTIEYMACQLTEGGWKFRLDPARSATFLDSLRVGTELEASGNVPEELKPGAAQDVGRGAERDGQHRSGIHGTVAGVDRRQEEIVLSVGTSTSTTQPPPRGHLHKAIRGGLVSTDRRKRARTQIQNGEAGIPYLAYILENRLAKLPHRQADKRRHEALPTHSAAWKEFKDTPTEQQKEALRVALNTPDIALIQGPPGTGKTQVIAALCVRLAEIAKDPAVIGRSILLTSHQHEAVEEAASRVRLRGIPTGKVDSGSREQPKMVIRAWRDELTEKLSAAIDAQQDGPLLRAALEAEVRLGGYVVAPPSPEGTLTLLTQVETLVSQYLPGELRERLTELKLNASTSTADTLGDEETRARVRSVARTLRCTSASFADDGADTALRATLQLRGLDLLTVEERALLGAAAGWTDPAEPPPFLGALAALRDRLLDVAALRAAHVAQAADPTVTALLADVSAALRDRLRTSREGTTAVLSSFLDDLTQEPQAVEEAVRRWGVTVGSTCQQAGGGRVAELLDRFPFFPTVIVDEAARSNPLDLMIPMTKAKRRIILVGDHRQLPQLLEPIVERQLASSEDQQDQAMLTALKQSMFERLYTYLSDAKQLDGHDRVVRLDTQFRMHEVLGTLVSRVFYEQPGDGALKHGRPPVDFHHDLPGYGGKVAAWIDVGLAHGAETKAASTSRRVEAKRVAAEVARLLRHAPKKMTFHVITFYQAQRAALLRAMLQTGLVVQDRTGDMVVRPDLAERLAVGTVDAFQGKEADVVLLSVTRSNDLPATTGANRRSKYGHLLLPNRLCVAMSRQQRLLVAVGDAAMFRREVARGYVEGLTALLELCEEGVDGLVVHP